MSVSGGTMSGRRAAQDPFSLALTFLQDADKVKARLKQITDAEAALRKTTEQYDGIANIAQNKAAAKGARTRAENVLAEAEAKARLIVAQAEESASNLRQAVQAEKGEFAKSSKKKEGDLFKRESQLVSDEADYLKRSAANDRRETTISSKAATQQERRRKFERLANKLKAACNEVLA